VLEPCAARLGARVVYAAGNHEDRAALRAELLDAPGEAPLDAVTWVDDLRIVTLDSSVPGLIHGELDEAQLAWLGDELRQAAPAGTVLVVHHPPIPSPIGLDLSRLRRPERLAAAIAGSDVRIVLSGHSHHGSAGTLGATPVWMAPALAFRYDLLAPPDVLRVRAATSVTRVDLGPDCTLAGPVEVDASEVLAEESIGALHRHLAQHEPPTP
jgi:3',5'-cyclic AMP phosphodiesterase CpdA